MTAHKWQKEIVAWAGGAEIEHRGLASEHPKIEFYPWHVVPHPFWADPNGEFRIKPERKVQPASPPCLSCKNLVDGRCRAEDMWKDFSCFEARRKALRYRVALFRDDKALYIVQHRGGPAEDRIYERDYMEAGTFVRWLTEWAEVKL